MTIQPGFNKNSSGVSSSIFNSGESINNVVIQTKKPDSPKNLTASTDSFSYIKLEWDIVNGATHYVIYKNNNFFREIKTEELLVESSFTGGNNVYYIYSDETDELTEITISAVNSLIDRTPLPPSPGNNPYNLPLIYFPPIQSSTDGTPFKEKRLVAVDNIDLSSDQPGKHIKYFVRAKKNGIESENSNEAIGYVKLEAPIVTATTDTYNDKIIISWSRIPGAMKYEIYKGTNPDPLNMKLYHTQTITEQLVSTNPIDYPKTTENTNDEETLLLKFNDNYNYSDYSVVPGVVVYYAVKAIGESIQTTSDLSNIISGKRSKTPETPIVTTIKGSYTDKILLNWSGVEYANTYKVYKDDVLVYETPWLYYEDFDVIPGKEYYYHVLAQTNYGTSEVNTDTRVIGTKKLSPPKFLKADKGAFEDRITLNWVASEGQVDFYEVYRKIQSDYSTAQETEDYERNWKLIATTTDQVFEYIDYSDDTESILLGNFKYEYFVRAISNISVNNSQPSEIVVGYLKTTTDTDSDTDQTLPIPSTPSITVSQGTFENYVQVEWNSCTDASGYIVFRNNIPIGTTNTNYLKYSSSFTLNSDSWELFSIDSRLPLLSTGTFSMILPENNEVVYGKELTFSASILNGLQHKIESVQPNKLYTFSIYISSTDVSFVQILYHNGFDFIISDPIAIQKDGSVKRISWSFVTTSNNPRSFVGLSNSNNIGKIKIYGAQLEINDVPTPYTETTTSSIISTKYSDFTAQIDTIYSYQVKAFNAYNSSISSSVTGFKKPNPPSIQSITKYNYDDITLKVKTNSTSSSNIKIYRGNEFNLDSNGIDYSLIATVPVSGSEYISFTDDGTGLTTGVDYYYTATVEFNGVESKRSNEVYSNLSNLTVPVNSLDYQIWGLYWSEDTHYEKDENGNWSLPNSIFDVTQTNYETRSIVTVDTNNNLTYNQNYKFKAIVPVLLPPCFNDINYGKINDNYRNPYNTDYNYNSDITGTGADYTEYNLWNYFLETSFIIPQGRRGILLKQWFYDLNPNINSHIDYYKNTSDGTIYNGNKYLTPWLQNQTEDLSLSFYSFVSNCKNNNFIFDYIVDNKQHLDYFYLSGKNNVRSDSKFGLYGYDFSLEDYSLNQMTPNSRLISAIVNDERFNNTTYNGKTFSELFYTNFINLWYADPLYGNSNKSITPLLSELTTKDLLTLFVESEDEIELQSAAVDSDGIFRTSPINYWSSSDCGLNSGVVEINQNNCPICLGAADKVKLILNDGICNGGCGHNGSENYKLMTYLNKNYFNQTDKYADIKKWYDKWANPNVVGNPKLTGYSLYHFVVNAWNSTIDTWLLDFYTKLAYSTIYNSENIQFNHVKYLNSSLPTVSSNEFPFYQKNKNNREYRSITSDNFYTSDSFYGSVDDIIYPNNLYPTELAPSTNTINDSYSFDITSTWNDSYKKRSGYVKKPSGTDTRSDYEKYSWSGYDIIDYSGSTPCNLIKYPEIQLVGDDGSWIPAQEKKLNLNNDTLNKWYIELTYKEFVNDIKRIRHIIRSDKYKFSPWISGPSAVEDSIYANSHGYWSELMFHVILHSSTNCINIYHPTSYSKNQDEIQHIQNVLDEWRFISNNNKTLPCSNSLGDPSLEVDRIDLSDAFEKYIISGGKLPNEEKYIWRITVPPKYFNKITGIATLKRVGNSEDIPETIEIDSKNDFKDSNFISSSRGVWIIRTTPTPPVYDIELPETDNLHFNVKIPTLERRPDCEIPDKDQPFPNDGWEKNEDGKWEKKCCTGKVDRTKTPPEMKIDCLGISISPDGQVAKNCECESCREDPYCTLKHCNDCVDSAVKKYSDKIDRLKQDFDLAMYALETGVNYQTGQPTGAGSLDDCFDTAFRQMYWLYGEKQTSGLPTDFSSGEDPLDIIDPDGDIDPQAAAIGALLVAGGCAYTPETIDTAIKEMQKRGYEVRYEIEYSKRIMIDGRPADVRVRALSAMDSKCRPVPLETSGAILNYDVDQDEAKRILKDIKRANRIEPGSSKVLSFKMNFTKPECVSPGVRYMRTLNSWWGKFVEKNMPKLPPSEPIPGLRGMSSATPGMRYSRGDNLEGYLRNLARRGQPVPLNAKLVCKLDPYIKARIRTIGELRDNRWTNGNTPNAKGQTPRSRCFGPQSVLGSTLAQALAVIGADFFRVLPDYYLCLETVEETIKELKERFQGKEDCWKSSWFGEDECVCTPLDCLGYFGMAYQEFVNDLSDCCIQCKLFDRVPEDKLPSICKENPDTGVNSVPRDPLVDPETYRKSLECPKGLIPPDLQGSVGIESGDRGVGAQTEQKSANSNLQSDGDGGGLAFTKEEQTDIELSSRHTVEPKGFELDQMTCKQCLAQSAKIRNDKIASLLKSYQDIVEQYVHCKRPDPNNPGQYVYENSPPRNYDCLDSCIANAIGTIFNTIGGILSMLGINDFTDFMIGLLVSLGIATTAAATVAFNSFTNNFGLFYQIVPSQMQLVTQGDLTRSRELMQVLNDQVRLLYLNPATPLYLKDLLRAGGMAFESELMVGGREMNVFRTVIIDRATLIQWLSNFAPQDLGRMRQLANQTINPVFISLRQIGAMAAGTVINGWEAIKNALLVGGSIALSTSVGMARTVSMALSLGWATFWASWGPLLTSILGAAGAGILGALIGQAIADYITCRRAVADAITAADELFFGKQSCWTSDPYTQKCQCGCPEVECIGMVGMVEKEYKENVERCCRINCSKSGDAPKLKICSGTNPGDRPPDPLDPFGRCGPSGPPDIVPPPKPVPYEPNLIPPIKKWELDPRGNPRPVRQQQ